MKTWIALLLSLFILRGAETKVIGAPVAGSAFDFVVLSTRQKHFRHGRIDIYYTFFDAR